MREFFDVRTNNARHVAVAQAEDNGGTKIRDALMQFIVLCLHFSLNDRTNGLLSLMPFIANKAFVN